MVVHLLILQELQEQQTLVVEVEVELEPTHKVLMPMVVLVDQV